MAQTTLNIYAGDQIFKSVPLSIMHASVALFLATVHAAAQTDIVIVTLFVSWEPSSA